VPVVIVALPSLPAGAGEASRTAVGSEGRHAVGTSGPRFAPGSEAKRTAAVVYFDPGDGHFLGTEILRFVGDYSGVPCPGSHDGTWEWIGFAWACHRPKKGHSH
jgi:hypothetical protein